MFCQCTLDACCFAMMFECILLDDPFKGFILADLGACQLVLEFTLRLLQNY